MIYDGSKIKKYIDKNITQLDNLLNTDGTNSKSSLETIIGEIKTVFTQFIRDIDNNPTYLKEKTHLTNFYNSLDTFNKNPNVLILELKKLKNNLNLQ